MTTIEVEAGVFSRLQNTLKTAQGKCITLTALVQDELNLWRYFIASLVEKPKNLR